MTDPCVPAPAMNIEIANGTVVKDKRDGPRKSFQRRAVLTFEEAAPLNIRTIDLSSNGVVFRLDQPLQAGLVCKIAIHAFFGEEASHIIARCSVADAILAGLHGFRIGLQFTSIDAANKSLVNRVVNGK